MQSWFTTQWEHHFRIIIVYDLPPIQLWKRWRNQIHNLIGIDGYMVALLGCFLQIHVPINQTRRYGMHLRPSDSIFLICVRFLFDWCMMQVKQLVRKDRNCKKGQQLTRQTHLPIYPKRQYGTPTLYLLPSDSIFLIYNQFRFNWCTIQVKHLMRRDRTSQPKTALRETPTLYLQSSNSLICICAWFPFDWCMIRAKQFVRRHGNWKKGLLNCRLLKNGTLSLFISTWWNWYVVFDTVINTVI
jgi:hypothetical protein